MAKAILAIPSTEHNLQDVTIWCDGACIPNPGVGGWGIVFECDGIRKELCGGAPDMTNQRAEIMAAIVALETLKYSCRVTLISDSQYLIKTMTDGWAKRTNLDLWERLTNAAAMHMVEWRWVKGHAGDSGNERADALSLRGIQKARAR